MDEATGDEKAITMNGRSAYSFLQAVRACKVACSGLCKSFNIRKKEFGRGYTCDFYEVVLDGQNCHGEAGLGGALPTTYMKYRYGDCHLAERNTTATCCNEDIVF